MEQNHYRKPSKARLERERKARARKHRQTAWAITRPVLILAVSIALCAIVVAKGYSFLMEKFLYPVDQNDATPITITIASGSGASTIGKLLYEAGGVDEDGNLLRPGLIRNKAVFKVYVDFTGKSSKLKAGTYVLSRNMSIAQIADILCEGNAARETVRFTIAEGTDVEGIAAKLVELGILSDTETFLSLCKTGEAFDNYSFVQLAREEAEKQEEERGYVLEGYLFPDTYEIYADATEKSIVTKMLSRFEDIYKSEYAVRAAELGMSTDDVIKLAALIEKEAKVEADFARVSAVFHTRIKEGMALESDASLRYIFKLNILDFTEEQRRNESLYNTIVYKGLGLGPITNPGLTAIKAALYPDEEYLQAGYLFFVLKDGKTGELAYAKTYQEHQANVAAYREFW